MAKFIGVYFNDIPIPSFVKVTGIKHSILPPISQNLLTVGGKAGAYDFGNQIGVRQIEIDIKIIMEEENTLPQLLEQLASWLYYDEPKKLVLGDNPNRYYMAKFTGDSDIKESFIVGEGTLTFICTEPYIYGLERTILIPPTYAGEELQIENTGNAETFPYMRFEITRDVTSFSVVAGDEFIDLGTPYDIDTQTPVNASPYILRDHLTTTNGWTNAPSVEEGTVQGTFEVYNNHYFCFRQANLDYGKGSTWHGAAMRKDLGSTVHNFDAYFYFYFKTQKPNELGRIQMTLLDVNGNMVGRVEVSDASVGQRRLKFRAWMYKAGGTGGRLIGHKIFSSKHHTLNGYMRIRRNGRYFIVELCNQVKGKYKRIYYNKFFDKGKHYQTNIAKVQIHTGAYSTYTPAYMEARNVVIISHDVTVNENEIPLILQAGDVLEIDNATGAILKNGIPFYQYLNPASTFIKLEKGINGIVISPHKCFTNGEIRYTERSL